MNISSGLEGSVTALVNSLLLAVDQRNYEYVRQCLADTVHFDTVSLGGTARNITAEEMITGLQSTFQNLSGTQHLIAAQLVTTDDDGTITSVGQYQAYHYRDDLPERRLWVHGGRHIYRLRHNGQLLKVEGLRVEMAWMWGDPAVISTPSPTQG